MHNKPAFVDDLILPGSPMHVVEVTSIAAKNQLQ